MPSLTPEVLTAIEAQGRQRQKRQHNGWQTRHRHYGIDGGADSNLDCALVRPGWVRLPGARV